MGGLELLIILGIILLFFGYKRLPQLGRSLGRSVQEFKGELRSKEAPEKKRPEAVGEEEGGEKAKAGPGQEKPQERQGASHPKGSE